MSNGATVNGERTENAVPLFSLSGLTMHVSCVLGWVKSLSSSLLSTTFFPAVLPLTSISLLAAPFSPEAPWEEVEDSSTALCPAWGVAWTVLHIINLEITGTHMQKTLHTWPTNTLKNNYWEVQIMSTHTCPGSWRRGRAHRKWCKWLQCECR